MYVPMANVSNGKMSPWLALALRGESIKSSRRLHLLTMANFLPGPCQEVLIIARLKLSKRKYVVSSFMYLPFLLGF
jgi:hypothetical protein